MNADQTSIPTQDSATSKSTLSRTQSTVSTQKRPYSAPSLSTSTTNKHSPKNSAQNAGGILKAGANDILKAIKVWQQQANTPPKKSAAQLLKLIRLAQLTQMPAEVYYQVLESLRRAADQLKSQLIRSHLKQAITPEPSVTQAVELHDALLSALIQSYERLCEKALKKADKPLYPLLRTSYQRQVILYKQRLFLAYTLYQAPSEKLWLDLHKAFLKGQRYTDLCIKSQKIQGYYAEHDSLANGYKQALLLAIGASTNSLNQHEMFVLYTKLPQWAKLCSLSPDTQNKYAFYINFQRDHGPLRSQARLPSSKARTSWLDISRLLKLLRKTLDTNISDYVQASTRRKLLGQWCQHRSHKRCSEKKRLTAFVGFDEIHQLLSSSEQRDQLEPLYVMQQDQSALGLGISCSRNVPQQLHVDQLIAIETDSQHWQLYTVKWAQWLGGDKGGASQKARHAAQLGLSLIANRFILCKVQAIKNKVPVLIAQQELGLLIQNTISHAASTKATWQLLVPNQNGLSTNDIVTITQGHSQKSVRLGSCTQHSPNYSVFNIKQA